MQPTVPQLKNCGFTLLELLVVIFLFSIVISSVYASYRATFHVIENVTFKLGSAHAAHVALERISEDLSGIVQGEETVFQGKNDEISGFRGDSLSFLSSAHIILDDEDQFRSPIIVDYSSEYNETSGLLDLYRSETIILPGNEEEVDESEKKLICKNLNSISFSYLDDNGDSVDEWESERDQLSVGEDDTLPQVPSVVYIELQLAKSSELEEQSYFKTAVALGDGLQ